jgi:hypothetical protein
MTSYVIGLDLGQTKDFTALAVVERQAAADAASKPDYALRHLWRFSLGTAYTEIVPAVAALRRSEPLREAPPEEGINHRAASRDARTTPADRSLAARRCDAGA